MKFGFTLLLLIAIPAVAQHAAGRESTDALIEKLRKDPGDIAAVGALEKRADDPRVIPALRETFVEAQQTNAAGTSVLRASQVIAIALMRLGIKDDIYFNELAKYARKTIAENPPDPYIVDAKGKADIEKRNPKFEEWCAVRKIEFTPCTEKWLVDLLQINALSGVHDQRAIPIFREALDTLTYGMVRYAAAGLADLNDKPSIPLIARACARLPSLQAESVAMAAMDFKDPAAIGLFDRCIADPKLHDQAKKEWQEKQKKTVPAPEERK